MNIIINGLEDTNAKIETIIDSLNKSNYHNDARKANI